VIRFLIGFGSQFGYDLPVNRDLARLDHFFGVTSRCESGGRDQFL
jgi:hypothetical protein